MLGIDARVPPHTLGSSHGMTRIIREAYYEHPLYVPLVQRAYDRWHALERQAGRTLLQRTGGLHIGLPDGGFIGGVLRSIAENRLEHDVLDPTMVRERFPAVSLQAGEIGVWEPRAGVLLAEPCLEAWLDAARGAGASLRPGDGLEGWDAQAGGVAVALESGTVRASHLVLALGPWLPRFVDLRLEVERQFVLWFEPQGDRRAVAAGHLPILLREYAPDRIVYAFPDLGHGVKVAIHHEGEPCDPGTVQRLVRPEETARVRGLLDAMIPGAVGRLIESVVCLYTNTEDRNFAIGAIEEGRVLVASACSGHGFKFAPVIAEIVADLVAGNAPAFDLTPFRLDRLVRAGSAG